MLITAFFVGFFLLIIGAFMKGKTVRIVGLVLMAPGILFILKCVLAVAAGIGLASQGAFGPVDY